MKSTGLALLLPLALAPASVVDAQTAPAPAAVTLPEVNVVGSTPLLGAGIDRDLVPAATSVLTPADIQRTGVPTLTGTLNSDLPSVNINDASGNPFQPDLLFRGFIASPVEGEEQGLAVYVNGARFNEPFGDTVDWDLIPSNAIDLVNVDGGSPVFGLNALGGSVNVKLKNGFTYHGGEIEAYGGSFGRAAGALQYGTQSDPNAAYGTAAYVAADVIQDQGYRNTSASTLYQVYTDLGWRGPSAEVHLGITGVSDSLGNPGSTPVQLLDVNRAANSTAPNYVRNKYLAVNLNGNYDVNDYTSVQGVAYYSNLTQRLSNGVTVDSAPCDDGSGDLCESPGVFLTDRSGNPIPDFLNGGYYGGTSNQGTDTNAYGASAQVSNTHDLFGLPNHVVSGLSFDAGDVLFDGSQTIGALNNERVVVPPEIVVDQSDLSIAPVRLATNNRYYGAFVTDTLNVTPKLALSLSGRFNAADIDLHDKLGTALDGSHAYNRFNPGAGATYKLFPNLMLFASYAESNRAPTASELSCASATQPCQLPNFFIGDPDLKQVVARTVEFGVRGRFRQIEGAKVTWNVDLFRTNSDDDIIFESSQVPGLDFYQNAGTTRRQGVEANLAVVRGPLRASLGYSYVAATFQSPLTLDSPLNPEADDNGQIHVMPGNKLPGVPAHRVKFVVDYNVTPRWIVGGSGILSSGQYLFGDEANQNSKVPGYFVLNLNTSYRITDHVQLFALVDNVLDRKYETYGTFAQVDGVPFPEVPGGVSNTRVESPAAPVAAYGGVRVTF